MKISIVIPAYNEEDRLSACLASVIDECTTGRCDIEIVVVNNASTDRTREIALSFPGIIVVDEPEKGLVRARQAGFLASTGDLIANIDADTVMPKGWLARVVREFEKDKDLAALSGPYIYYDLSPGARALVKVFYAGGYVMYLFNQYVIRVGAMLQGGNFIVDRNALQEIGGFDTSIEFYGEDTDIAKRLAKVGRVKWTFGLPMYTSGRRLKHEGLIRTGWRYALNFFWTTFLGRPYTKKYTDIRSV